MDMERFNKINEKKQKTEKKHKNWENGLRL